MTAAQSPGEAATLGDIADLKIGRTPARASRAYWTAGSIPWVSIADMANGPLHTTKEAITPLALTNCFGGHLVPAGTLLMSFKLTIGKLAILNMPAVHNEAIVSIFPHPEVDRDYLFYYLQTADLLLEQDAYVKGKTLNRDKLLRVRVWLPPLDTQQRIARILSTIQRTSAATRAQLIAARQLRQVILQREVGDAAWPLFAIGDIAETSSGGTPRSDVAAFYGGGIPWVQSSEVRDCIIMGTTKTLTEEGLTSSAACLQPAETLLLAMYGATAGQVALLGVEASTNQAVCAIRPHAGTDARYLFFALQISRERLRAERVGAAQPNLSQQIIRGFQLPVPGLAEQERVVRVFMAFDDLIAAMEHKLVALGALFSSALASLLGGGQ